jgi:type VI secretion system protein VasG
MQGESAGAPGHEQAVGAVVQDWTGIPVGRMVKNEIESVLKSPRSTSVIGRSGLEMTPARADLARQARQRTIEVFMLAGPSAQTNRDPPSRSPRRST